MVAFAALSSVGCQSAPGSVECQKAGAFDEDGDATLPYVLSWLEAFGIDEDGNVTRGGYIAARLEYLEGVCASLPPWIKYKPI